MSKSFIFVVFFILASVIPYFCPAQSKLLLGIDVLIKDDFKILQGKRVGLVANSASRTSTQKMTVEYFVHNPNFTLTAIFTPEHGFFTTIPAGESVPDDSIYGVPLFSLYGNNRKPTPYQLSLVDIIVFDLQDIGVRSYTYISTLFKVMEACAEFDIPLVILDRPNPLGGNLVDGNVTDWEKISFVSIIPIPYLHGCTIGEIALMINGEGWLKSNGTTRKCNLTIVKMEGWKRDFKWEQTGLNWFQTSPNVKTTKSIRGLAFLGPIGELSLFNLGVGTQNPFQKFEVHNVNSRKLDSLITSLKFDGIVFRKTAKKNSYFIDFEANADAKLYTYGMLLLLETWKNFPHLFKLERIKTKSIEMFKKVTGTDTLWQCLLDGNEKKFKSALNKGLDEFLLIRSKYLMYK